MRGITRVGYEKIDRLGWAGTTRKGYPPLTRTGYGRHPGRPRSIAASNHTVTVDAMTRVTPLARLRVPLGGQEIELQQIDYEAGGMSLLRTRIREKSRFTVFEIDPATAAAWGEALLAWARAQEGQAPQ